MNPNYGVPNYPSPANNPGMTQVDNRPSTFNVPDEGCQKAGHAVFQRYDTSKTGKIPVYMLERMLEEYAYLCRTKPPAKMEGDYYMRIFDNDKDGQLSYQEWIRNLRKLGGHDVSNLAAPAYQPQPQPQYIQQQPQTIVYQQPPQQTIIYANGGGYNNGLGMLGLGAIAGYGLGGGCGYGGYGGYYGDYCYDGGWGYKGGFW